MEDDDAVGGGNDDEMKAPALTNETLRRLQKAILEVSMPIEVLYFLELKQPSVRNCISQLVQLSARISTDQRDRQSRCLHANSVQWKCSIDKELCTQQEVEE